MSCRSGVEEDMQQSSDEDFDLPPPTLVHTPQPSMSSSSVDLIDEKPDLEIERQKMQLSHMYLSKALENVMKLAGNVA